MKRFLLLSAALLSALTLSAQSLKLNNSLFFESRGSEVHLYDGDNGFSITQGSTLLSKIGGLSVSGNMTAFKVEARHPDLAGDRIEIRLGDGGYSLFVKGESRGPGVSVSVFLTEALPQSLEGRISFAILLRPDLFLGRNCFIDGRPRTVSDRKYTGNSLVLLPENPEMLVNITSAGGFSLSGGDDGVLLESPIPSGRTGNVVEWLIVPSGESSRARASSPVVSRIGYLCAQTKRAVLKVAEGKLPDQANVYRINSEGYRQLVMRADVKVWPEREDGCAYAVADFSGIRETGLYCVEFGDVLSDAFPVDTELCRGEWRKALPVLLRRDIDAGSASGVAMSLVRLWETFRPEDDTDADGYPDVLVILQKCLRQILQNDAGCDASVLAAAGRVLKDFSPSESALAISMAREAKDPAAAMQLWFATADTRYKAAASSTKSFPEQLEMFNLMDSRFRQKVKSGVEAYAGKLAAVAEASPYGMPEGADARLEWALDIFALWQRFPNSVDPNPVLRCLSAMYGESTYADARMLESMDTKALADFIRLSLAYEEIARVAGR